MHSMKEKATRNEGLRVKVPSLSPCANQLKTIDDKEQDGENPKLDDENEISSLPVSAQPWPLETYASISASAVSLTCSSPLQACPRTVT